MTIGATGLPTPWASEVELAEYTHDPTTAHGRARRDQIIAAATQLFHDGGFHATGIDDIGAVAGITGPGIYRHFAGKSEILMAVLDRLWMRIRTGIDAAEILGTRDALTHLVDRHVGLAVHHRAECTLLVEDLRFLPDEYQALAAHNRATYREAWAVRIAELHPPLSIAEARLITEASWRISAGTARAMADSGLGDDEVVTVLTDMTMAAIAGAASRA